MIQSTFNKAQMRFLQLNDKFEIIFMCMGGLPAGTYVYPLQTWCLWRLEEGIGSPGTRAKRIMICHVNVEK